MIQSSDIAPVLVPPITKLKKLPHIAVTVFAGPQKNILHLKDAPAIKEARQPG